MIQPLTPQEKAELVEWIAINVFSWTWHEETDYLPRRLLPPDYDPINGQARLPQWPDEWSAAGPLFDRYEFLLYRRDDGIYIYRNLDDLDYDVILACGTTGPEAIAKSVKQYEEGRRER